MTKYFVLFLCISMWPTTVWANFTLRQDVNYKVGTETYDAQFYWYVKDSAFRVDVRRGKDIKSYVFNGRVFYTCGNLEKAQLAYLKEIGTNPDVLKQLEIGACQAASLDFSVQFFLSPFAALLAKSVSEGLKTNIEVSSPAIDLKGSTQTLVGQKCVDFSRSYKVSELTTKGATSVAEEACHAPGLKWRTNFDMELRKNLMRQPAGRKFHAFLKTDVQKMAGMTLSQKLILDGNSTVVVTAKELKLGAPKPDQVGIPAGFEIFDPMNPALSAKVKPTKKDKGATATVADVINFLFIGGNPAAVVVNAAAGH